MIVVFFRALQAPAIPSAQAAVSGASAGAAGRLQDPPPAGDEGGEPQPPRQVLLLHPQHHQLHHRGAPGMERSHGKLTQPTTSQRCSGNGAISW